MNYNSIFNILKIKTRFHKTKTKRILQANKTWKIITAYLNNPNRRELRNLIAKTVNGYGLKESAHFLRNIGIKGYAILDKHVLNCLHEFNVIEEPIRPSTRERYREMERKMIIFSNQIGIPMDELDLLFWSRKNGKIMK